MNTLLKCTEFIDSFDVRLGDTKSRPKETFSSKLNNLKWILILYSGSLYLKFEWDNPWNKCPIYIHSASVVQYDTVSNKNLKCDIQDKRIPASFTPQDELKFRKINDGSAFTGTVNIYFSIFEYPSFGINQFCLKLFKTGEFADISIRWSEDEKERLIPAHKSILRTGSPLFVELFSEETKVWDITSLCPKRKLPISLNCMLLYFYCGTIIENNENDWIGLYELAQTFRIPKLSTICINKIKEGFIAESKETMEEYIDFAIQHDIKDLLSMVKLHLAKVQLEEVKEQLK